LPFGLNQPSSAQNAFGYEALLGTPQAGDLDVLSLGLLLLFVGLGAVTQNRRAAAAILVTGGVVQLVFGALVAVNRRGLAERLARYCARRPAMLGGFLLNRFALSWRLQGATMMLFGAGLIAWAVKLVR
jgi:NADH:ubiquinone oxidoreductase subunit 4 (subunit M)